MSTSLGILPKFVATGSRSVLPVTPRTRANKPRLLPSPRPNITATVNISSRNQTVVGDTKKSCAQNSHLKHRKRQPCRRVYLGAPRCSRIGPYLLPPMFGYKNFGRSSDCNNGSENTNSASQHPNPYTQIAKEVKQMLKQKVDSSLQLGAAKQAGNSKTHLPETLIPGHIKVDIVSKGEPPKMVSGVNDPSDERRLREQEVQDGELCDDEEELYTELRLDENIDEAAIQFETYRALHLAQMEDMCKIAQPQRLLRQLNNAGYFDYNYDGYTRIPVENPSTKYSSTKPTDRLYMLLSIR